MNPTCPLVIVGADEGLAEGLRQALGTRLSAARWYDTPEALLGDLSSGPPPLVLFVTPPPTGDQRQALGGLLCRRPDLPIVAVSREGRASTIVEALRLGAFDFVVVAPDDPAGAAPRLAAALHRASERPLSDPAPGVVAGPAPEPVPPDETEASWAESAVMRDVAYLVERVADSDVTVLVRGESGVGKEVVARAIHRRSRRRHGPLVKVNCAALPADLLESELFGHERGAFTGADTARIGKFEHARGGTILLDEIAEMPARLQAKLLHVLQDGTFTRLGSNRVVTADARILAATNRDLDLMMRDGRFREDLYYRLKVIEIPVPPLRERRDEIPTLTEDFMRRYAERYRRPAPHLDASVLTRMVEYEWPGNVRQLENFVKRLVLLQNPALLVGELGPPPPRVDTVDPVSVRVEVHEPELATAGVASGSESRFAPGPGSLVAPASPRTLPDIAREAVEAAERREIGRALQEVRWNRRRAARLLGVSYKTLLNKIRELQISDADVAGRERA